VSPSPALTTGHVPAGDLTGDTIEDGHGRTVTFSFDGAH
jgi:hypothetical protein